MGPAVAVIGAIVGAVGTVASFSAQKKAAKAQEKQQELSTRRSRRQAIREAQVRRAAAVNAAAQLGGLDGSAIAGGVTSLNSQTSESIGFSNTMSGLSREISKFSNQAQLLSDAASLGFAAFKSYGSKDPKPKAATTSTNQPMNYGPSIYGNSAYSG